MFKLLDILSKLIIKAYYREVKRLQLKYIAERKIGDKLKSQSEFAYKNARESAKRADVVLSKAEELENILGN